MHSHKLRWEDDAASKLGTGLAVHVPTKRQRSKFSLSISISRWFIGITFALLLSRTLRFLARDSANWYHSKEERIVRQSVGLHGGIAWSACPDVTHLDCAYLTVPMNHLDPQPNSTVSLALRRLPATVRPGLRKGTLFINPGGPGGSGHAAVARLGPSISIITEGQYDILGWDPRGVNLTTPAVNCFQDEASANLHEYTMGQIGIPYTSRLFPEASPYLHPNISTLSPSRQLASNQSELAFLKKYRANVDAEWQSCMKFGNKELLKSLSTAFTARDMKWILEASGEVEDGLNYWGFSYGTDIGFHFVGMFPELVNRVVLDGMGDPQLLADDFIEWYKELRSSTDQVYWGFLEECVSSGPAYCALARANQTSADLHERLTSLSARLLEAPMAVASRSGAGILTAANLHPVIFTTMYSPKRWKDLATALNNAEAGKPEMLWEMSQPGEEDFVHKRWDDNPFGRVMNGQAGMITNRATLCSDQDRLKVTNTSLTEVVHHMRHLSNISIWDGDSFALSILECQSYKVEPYERFAGPFIPVNGTAHPFLIVQNTNDPVCALPVAKRVTKQFGRSASLLIQDGYGHCTPAQSSVCTATAIRNYFNDGVLPKSGSVCKADDDIFGNKIQSFEGMNSDDFKLLQTMKELGHMLEGYYSRNYR
ncbi:alpha/beta-hydrolase [Atractiella rhizophila]|nr:alpha/beta-hydrolase [Atractiella rhizophila]